MEQITLIQDKPIIFNLRHSFSYIKIEKIIVLSTNTTQPTEWSNILSSLNLHLSYDRSDRVVRKDTINLIRFLSAYHKNPVFDFENEKWEIPEENVKNISSFGNYCTKLTIELKKISDLNENFHVIIFFQSSPGVNVQNG